MKNLITTIFILSASIVYSQERKPNSYNAPTSSGLSPSEKLVQQEQQKTPIQKATEGFVKGMERTDSGGTAAAAGTLLYNTFKDKSTPDVKPTHPTPTSSTPSSGRASQQ